MTERRCVELTAVYDDGTVERWTGEHLVAISDSGRWSEDFVAGDGAKRGAPTVEPMRTKPLRRVTVVRGTWSADGLSSDAILGPGNEPYGGFCLCDLLPRGVMGHIIGEEPEHDWRFTVEAVPVEDSHG